MEGFNNPPDSTRFTETEGAGNNPAYLTMVFDLGLNVRGFDSKYDWNYSYSDDDGISSIKITSKPDSKTPLDYTFTTEPSCGHGV